jgi:hypothetical protein
MKSIIKITSLLYCFFVVFETKPMMQRFFKFPKTYSKKSPLPRFYRKKIHRLVSKDLQRSISNNFQHIEENISKISKICNKSTILLQQVQKQLEMEKRLKC